MINLLQLLYYCSVSLSCATSSTYRDNNLWFTIRVSALRWPFGAILHREHETNINNGSKITAGLLSLSFAFCSKLGKLEFSMQTATPEEENEKRKEGKQNDASLSLSLSLPLHSLFAHLIITTSRRLRKGY